MLHGIFQLLYLSISIYLFILDLFRFISVSVDLVQTFLDELIGNMTEVLQEYESGIIAIR